MPPKAKLKPRVPDDFDPVGPEALADLVQAIKDLKWAHDRAAMSTRCARCGVADSMRVASATHALVRAALLVEHADLDALVAPCEDDDAI